MAATVKMCDMDAKIIIDIFCKLNSGKVGITKNFIGSFNVAIVTGTEPCKLIYPEGWYYEKGYLTNERFTKKGIYERIEMVKPNGKFWADFAKYCTLD